MPVLGAAGLLALASGASVEAPVDTSTPNTGVSHQIFLGEEEISDVSLATFYVLEAGSLKPGVQLARDGGCGCGQGCGGGGGCRGCRGCGRCRGLGGGCGEGCRIGFGFGGCRGLWMRRMRPGLVGTLQRRVCCRCRLLSILERLPPLLALTRRYCTGLNSLFPGRFRRIRRAASSARNASSRHHQRARRRPSAAPVGAVAGAGGAAHRSDRSGAIRDCGADRRISRAAGKRTEKAEDASGLAGPPPRRLADRSPALPSRHRRGGT
jgi:hypothetical protein